MKKNLINSKSKKKKNKHNFFVLEVSQDTYRMEDRQHILAQVFFLLLNHRRLLAPQTSDLFKIKRVNFS